MSQYTGGWDTKSYKDKNAERWEADKLKKLASEAEVVRLKLAAQALELKRIEDKERAEAQEIVDLEAEKINLQGLIALEAKKLLMIRNQEALLILSLSYPFMNILTDDYNNDIITISGPMRSGPQGV